MKKGYNAWCHICLRIGYDNVKRFKETKYSICSTCLKCFNELKNAELDEKENRE